MNCRSILLQAVSGICASFIITHHHIKALNVMHLITFFMKGYCGNLWPTLLLNIIFSFEFSIGFPLLTMCVFLNDVAFSFCRLTLIKNCTRPVFLNTVPSNTNQTLFVLKNQNPKKLQSLNSLAQSKLVRTPDHPLTDCSTLSQSQPHWPN